MSIGHVLVLLLHALAGWIACGSIIAIGRNVTSMAQTLVVHAIGAPIVFGLIALLYFKRFDLTTPFRTAAIFVSIVILMDFVVVALLVERSFAMFGSPLGTWIPFAGIFGATYGVGWLVSRAGGSRAPSGRSP